MVKVTVIRMACNGIFLESIITLCVYDLADPANETFYTLSEFYTIQV